MSSRFDLPLTYDARDLTLAIGDVVRVTLRKREVLAFVVSSVRVAAPAEPALQPVLERLDVPRAFDEIGLHLARFIADRYVCTLGEALSSVVLSAAVPRMRERINLAGEPPNAETHPPLPPRLVRLIWEDLADGFELERLLRHPEARRIGDRQTLLAHVRNLERSGALRRDRRLVDPRTRPYRVKLLEVGDGTVRGKKAESLVALVRAQPAGVPRADALLAGFSHAVIARAVKAGALRELERTATAGAKTLRTRAALPPATPEQRAALQRVHDALQRRQFDEMLLYGVTGSGKTYVYVDAIAHVLRAGGRAIVLVPEISLTPQTARTFEAAFGSRVAVLH
ncbi:MAG: DEAD/DEAH box helicase family protein, partial [Candidatus Eremiobacteraeota bacterium]|nr:DEAD/DEAH box helicase family protein [Candidatus Eremiobacteraeota bacterium]